MIFLTKKIQRPPANSGPGPDCASPGGCGGHGTGGSQYPFLQVVTESNTCGVGQLLVVPFPTFSLRFNVGGAYKETAKRRLYFRQKGTGLTPELNRSGNGDRCGKLCSVISARQRLSGLQLRLSYQYSIFV